MEKVDFNALPADVRETFVARALAYGSPGGPLLRELTGLSPITIGRAFLLLAAVVMLYSSWMEGFGKPSSDSFRAGIGHFVLIAISLAIICHILLAGWWRISIKRALPYPPGIYVFPLEIVDARSSRILRYPMSQVLSISSLHDDSILRGGAEVTFHFKNATTMKIRAVGSKATVADDIAKLQEARRQAVAPGPKDEATMELFDPFHHLGRAGSGWWLA